MLYRFCIIKSKWVGGLRKYKRAGEQNKRQSHTHTHTHTYTQSVESIFHTAVLLLYTYIMGNVPNSVWRQGIPPHTPTHMESRPQHFITAWSLSDRPVVWPYSGNRSFTAGHH